MSISSSHRVLCLALGMALTACGSDLTFPEGGPPVDDRAPARLLAEEGDGQSGRVGKQLDDPLVVRLTDASDRPVAGADVEFRFEPDVPKAEIDPASTTTDEEGLARAEVRLGINPGEQTVEARLVQASTVRATFGLTALARNDHDGDNDDD
jgi:hypothetical protein